MGNAAYTKRFKSVVDRITKNNGDEISYKGRVTADMAIDFVDAIPENSNISKIDFEASSMDDETFGLLLSGLVDKSSSLKKLSNLSFHGNNITNLSNNDISNAIKNLPLKEFSLMESLVDNEMFDNISISMRDSRTLRNLDLWGNKISDNATRECLSLLKNPVHPLEKVNLHKNDCSKSMLHKISFLQNYKKERKDAYNLAQQGNVGAIIARGRGER